ncbi:hypothetical protein HY496_02730 [Candidatus Woesearchaeota archaeon]|nr:hypothetical protein [Candidatus Woesearchaeota archaeon]
MKKALTSLLAAGMITLNCSDENLSQPERNYACDVQRGQYTREELLKKLFLAEEEFEDLIKTVNSLSDLELLLAQREIIYPSHDLAKMKYAKDDLEYGAPWQTHNRGYGVCDELAMYAIPFLLHIPTISDITLVEIKGTFIRPGEEKSAVHAYLVFREGAAGWRYFNNTFKSIIYVPLRRHLL